MYNLSNIFEYSSFLHLGVESSTFQRTLLDDYNDISLTEVVEPFNLIQENSNSFFDEEDNNIGGFPETTGSDESNSNKLKKKRGRKNNKKEVQHSEYKNDCRMAKIQISYFSFLIKFINAIMKKLKKKYYFLDLNGKYKSNVNQSFRNELNCSTIKKILLEAPISGKYKNNQTHNIEVCKKLEEENSIVLKILNQNFLSFFENIYYISKRKLDLSSFGFDPCELELTKDVKMFEDLLLKRKKQDSFKYENELKKCVEKYFIKPIGIAK